MKVRKLSKKKKKAAKGGYLTEGRRGSRNIHDRRPGSINIGPNTGTWHNGDRRIESGVNARMEMGVRSRSSYGISSGSGSGGGGDGSNRARAGRGNSV